MIYYLLGRLRRRARGHSNDTAYVVAVVGALLFFISLVLHELGHALVARRNGIGVSSIELWFFGGLAKLTRDPTSPGVDFRIAVAGPAVTLRDPRRVLRRAGRPAGHRPRGRGDAPVRHDHAREGSALVAGRDQPRGPRLQPAPGIPARRRAHRPRDRVEDHGRPEPRDAPRGPPRPGARVRPDRARRLRDPPRRRVRRDLVPRPRLVHRPGGARRGRLEPVLRAPGGRDRRRRDGHPARHRPRRAHVLDAQDEFFLRYRFPWFPVVDGVGRFLGILREESVEGAVNNGHPAITVGEVLGPHPDAGSFVRRDTPIEQLLGSETLRRLGALMVVDAEARLCGVVTIEQVRRALAAPCGPIAAAGRGSRRPPRSGDGSARGRRPNSRRHASTRRPDHRRRPRRPARRPGRRRRGRLRRDHEQGPPGALALGRGRRRHQRGAQPRGHVGVARLRHRQGLGLPRRPGRDRGHVPRGARRGAAPRAHRRHVPPQREGRPRHRAPSAAPRRRARTTSPTSPARRSCTSSTSS